MLGSLGVGMLGRRDPRRLNDYFGTGELDDGWKH